MKTPHLFEFMDLDWLPGSLRATLRDILECGNSQPFRSYYDWVAAEVSAIAQDKKCKRIVELGAGTAPITRRLAKKFHAGEVALVPCDINPDRSAYKALAAKHEGLVFPIYEAVDFFETSEAAPDTLVFLSATFHHLRPKARAELLARFASKRCHIAIFEPLNKNWQSLLFVIGSIVPALLVPLAFVNRPERFRRFLWCWLLPIAPLAFWWDGWISCIRQWTIPEWQIEIAEALQNPDASPPRIQQGLFTHLVHFSTGCRAR